MSELRFEEIENGAVAYRGGRVAARLAGELVDRPRVGLQAWITAEGEQPFYPDLYALAGARWVTAGYLAHQIVVDAADTAQLDLWYGLCFGRQQVYASRPVAGAERYEGPVRARAAGPDDLETALSLADLIRRHLLGPPVWSNVALADHDESRHDWAEFLAEPETAYFLAELDGETVGHLALHDEHEPGAIYLEIAATRPEARGRGAMRALTAAALAWAEERGYERCDTDWRSTNLEAARFWTRRGFAPVRYRLHRYVAR